MGSFFAALAHFLVTAILPTVGTVAAGYGIAYLQKQLAKAGIELTAAQTDALKTDVTHAIQAVEEQAARRQAAGSPMSASEKLNTTTALVAKTQPEIPISGITQMIDAVLPEVRARLGDAAGRMGAAALTASLAK